MPDRCCVTACKSNYDDQDIYVSVFLFPKDDNLKELWIKNIPRKDFRPTTRSVVCEKHFAEDKVIRFDELPVNGEVIKIKRNRPKLVRGAVPTIFPGCPAYLTKKESESTFRVSRDSKLQKADETVLKTFLLEDKITSYDEFVKCLEERVNLPKDVKVINSEGKTCILFLNLDSIPNISKSIKINSDFNVFVYIGEIEASKDFQHILESNKLILWSQLENILSILTAKTTTGISHYEAALHHWNIHVAANVLSKQSRRHQFLLEQLKLSSKQKAARRYSSDIYRFASCLYLISPSCYRALLNCKVIVLPCVESLKKLLNVISLSSSTVSLENMKYISAKCNKLKTEEKLVNLLVDEIHINRKVSYKGKLVSGFAENQESNQQQANSVQAFMISSCFSKYKEVVALVPVSSMTSQDLMRLTIQVLEILHKAGFEVLSIVSDNNSVNRNMFTSMANGSLTNSAVKNPVNGSKLYLLFDAVHILKCIRNNWLNQLDSEKTFICPDFSNDQKVIHPRFDLLRKAFKIEQESSIKYAFHLNSKTLYPTNIERQNVQFAVNVFHESNPAALERLSKHLPNAIHTVEDTVTFLKLIKKWWDVMNVSHQHKGTFTKNADSLPITSESAESIIFMEKFTCWVRKWRGLQLDPRSGCLTNETFIALIQTSSTIINIAKNLLQDGARYVLTTKFQTDALEFRFSQYRQMSGCNYHVSLQQVLESERKLRIKSVLHLHSHQYGDIPLRIFINELSFDEMQSDIDLQPFADIVEDLDIKVSPQDAEILTYIAGYCVFKLKLICNTCKIYFYGRFNLSVDIDEKLLLSPLEKIPHSAYLDLINRGGMKTPSSNAVFSLSVCFVIFQELISSKYEKLYMSYNIKQHTLLVKLTELYLNKSSIFDFADICSECNTCFSIGIIKGIQTFSNVCLNNYAKNKSDQCVHNGKKTESVEKCVTKKVNKSKSVKKCVKRKLQKFQK